MAKKNSSKTRTEKSIQMSEPRVVSYGDWKGVNFVDAPLTWKPLETARYDHRQTDLPKNYLMVQNNVVTTDTLSLETRYDSVRIADTPSGARLTGVSFVFHRWLFVVGRYTSGNSFYERIYYRDMTASGTQGWTEVKLKKIVSDYTDISGTSYWSGYTGSLDPLGMAIREIGAYENNLIVTATKSVQSGIDEQDYANRASESLVFLANLNYDNVNDTINITCDDFVHGSNNASYLSNIAISNPYIPNPNQSTASGTSVVTRNSAPKLRVIGMNSSQTAVAGTVNDGGVITGASEVKVEVCFCYTNRFGSTLVGDVATIYTEFSPTFWSSSRYVEVYWPECTNTSTQSGSQDPRITRNSGITGIDFYGRDTENTNWVFIGHINIDPSQEDSNGTKWMYAWLGNMTDISQWTTSQLNVPTQNDTKGPQATHFAVHDSRLYYWGDPDFPYRLYIGGTPGAEFSTARGLGGAWVDIEPGSGYQVMGTAKWKTVSGANIVTIMCGNANTNQVKRFNLVETNITITNEISYKGYMYEEVSNVVGCNSRWGYGVFSEGLYSVSRYGLFLTTMAMEYNSQMKNQSVSDVIKPIFSERIGTKLKNARMVCIDNVIYLAFASDEYTGSEADPIPLDNVILCYDITNQAWYTFTHDQDIDDNSNGTSSEDYYEYTTSKAMYTDSDQILNIISIDSDQCLEGLGVITSSSVYLYPTTGTQDDTVPRFPIIVETAEINMKEPKQATTYIQQLEFRFDYLVGDPEYPAKIIVEGTDYYGRSFTIEKNINDPGGRGFHGKTGEMRDYIEWVRVDKLVESFRIRIIGRVRFRLTHINVKVYVQADAIGTAYGFDAQSHYLDAHGTSGIDHHYINSYNDLRRALVT